MKHVWVMVDVEADGPIPGDYSMIAIGAVVVEPSLDRTFHGLLKPISDKHIPDALKVSGFTREETFDFHDPEDIMNKFYRWLVDNHVGKRLMFVSDNNGFDWQFINWYFHHFIGKNPFGHSSTNLGSIYKGMAGNTVENFKHLRKTKHDHNPVNDAKSNAEAMLEMQERGMKFWK